MPPRIEASEKIALTLENSAILQGIFTRYQKLIVVKEFGQGLSGGRVFEVRPIRSDGKAELPTVVKLAPLSLIQQEWQAYRQHVQHRLPRIAQVTDKPVLSHKTGWGGLRYQMMGEGAFEVTSLRDYCMRPDVSPARIGSAIDYLLRIMDSVWWQSQRCPDFHPSAGYDQILPVNLLLRPFDSSYFHSSRVLTPQNAFQQHFAQGEQVHVSKFLVHKTNPELQAVTLRSPFIAFEHSSYFLRSKGVQNSTISDLSAGGFYKEFTGEVVETRLSKLQTELRNIFGVEFDANAPTVAISAVGALPNPLLALDDLLNWRRPINLATVHGDFNLDNVLIEPETGAISLIDFADAREDHVLHDLLRLETEVITRLLPEILQAEILQAGSLSAAAILAQLFNALHHAAFAATPDRHQPTHPALQKPWAILSAARRSARKYSVDASNLSEYYHGLTFYLLGALKFKNLDTMATHPLPKQLAFWGATLAYAFLRNPPGLGEPLTNPEQPITGIRRDSILPDTRGIAESAPQSDVPLPPPTLLAVMPIDTIATRGALPAQSRMPFERNPIFVGRQRYLMAIARHLRTPNPPDQPAAVFAITGLGGLGKTQLASEFVHRYGRFFAGGVYWVSMADARAIPTEVAACGRAMKLRSDWDELPLEEQGRRVEEVWQEELPRLLVFDNCEEAELLARWRPQRGGCRILLSSRRAGWEDAEAVQALALEVLERHESVDLIRHHRPDADGPLLDQIADQVGDLPLALHLAGSYLRLYRQAIDAEHYLQQLQHASLLNHPSLQQGEHSPTEHDQNIYRTIAVSSNQLDRSDPGDTQAIDLLAITALLAPGEPILQSLLVNLTTTNVPTAAERLAALGLVRPESIEQEPAIRLHRLVVEFAKMTLPNEIATLRPSVEQAICVEAERVNAAGYPAQLVPWQVHLRVVTNAAGDREDELAARLCAATGEHFRQIGDYERAKRALEQAVKIHQIIWNDDNAISAQCLSALGHILLWSGDLQAAQTTLEQSLKIQQKTLGESSETANTLSRLGFLLQLQKQIVAARPYHEQALTMRQRLFGSIHTTIAESLCNLAYLDYAEGKFDLAMDLLQRALTVQQTVWGVAHTETARVLTNLGELLQFSGELQKAQTVLLQALTIQEKELGQEHPEVARILDNLGGIAHLQANFSEAREYFKRALEISSARLGQNHPRTKRIIDNLIVLDSTVQPSLERQFRTWSVS